MFKKMFLLMIIAILVLSALPTTGVFAKGGPQYDLAKKWDELNKIYKTQSFEHVRVTHKLDVVWHNEVEKKVSANEKSIYYNNMAKCDMAFAAAQKIVAAHAGFDAKGKVTNKVLADTSVKQLNFYLQLHARAIQQLKGFVH